MAGKGQNQLLMKTEEEILKWRKTIFDRDSLHNQKGSFSQEYITVMNRYMSTNIALKNCIEKNVENI